jgi:hypothetical protein
MDVACIPRLGERDELVANEEERLEDDDSLATCLSEKVKDASIRR